jgi:imidazole glycerol-phosphate synthase subunit HisF
MPVTKRIIPCLDIKDGQVVKGTNFVGLRAMGDPVVLALKYAEQKADELVLLDITATVEGRSTFLPVVTAVAKAINIPFTVGGAIKTLQDAYKLLGAGADKTSVNSSAVRKPALLSELANEFGSQCVVLAIDAKRVGNWEQNPVWEVYVDGGRTPTGLDVLDWLQEGVRRGAGELLITSINQDGARTGFDTELMRRVAKVVTVPVIASGGAGNPQHFADVLAPGMADAALAAGILHEDLLTIPDLKLFLKSLDISVR